ncbi:amino acid adenylation domain-containing protein [Maribacter algarum]|uniref:Amino acid adenylation domain-containing protein n=1 Tax=Maribacter algarum (ex Zhang et al. 2020) TaxID=2578118 RepID=A0A5S3PMW7_9FLAO|nr:non-ribosomal peptide synthetase [Maribacter algarum]TMM53766.1 amino acid adenylation domain-containing protein [Maribacter algarum]
MKKEKELQKDKASLLSQWKSKNKSEAGSPKILKAPVDAVIPLSHGQRRLWFLQQLYPESPFYNYSERYVFKGKLDTEKLLKALELVCDNHDILRSTYHMEDGELFLKVEPSANIKVTHHDLSNLDETEAEESAKELMLTDAQYSFNLSKHPMVLVSLIKIHATKHALLLTLHHISTDKWSMGVLRKEWAEHYKSLCSDAVMDHLNSSIKYSDFTYWQQNQDIDSNQLNYWKEKLSGDIPYINLPTDFPKPAEPSFKGGASPTQFFTKELSTSILELAKELEVTPYVLFLSVYYTLLFRYSGQKDILIGSPVASRDQKALENLIGFFNDTVVLRTDLSPNMPFKELVKQVKQTTLDAFSNKDVPFDTLVKELKQERSLSINPFFQVMFLYHAVPKTPSFGAELTLEHGFFDAGVSKFDLTLYISEEEGILSSTFEYTSDLFEATSIDRFQEHFKNLLEGIVKNSNRSISEVPMLTEKESKFFNLQHSKVENPFADYSGIHDIISDISSKHPENIAVSYMDDKMSYKKLNDKAALQAKKILNKTKNRNEIVGLCIDRSLDMIVGMLAILKAGCAYVPIDPKYPAQRIDFMLTDAEVNIVVTHSELCHLFSNFDSHLISIDSSDSIDGIQEELPKVEENDLAYMIYTSGSTGNPKGVPITHKNIINSTGGRLEFYNTNPEVFLLMSSISFDSSKAGIFWTLCTGGNLIIAENRIEQDISRIEEVIAQNGVSHTLMLPSLYNLILEHGNTSKLKSLDTVMVAGEACPVSLCAAHFEKFDAVELYNEYGPTEATVWCIAHKIVKEHLTATVPLGKAVANAEIYLLDEFLNRVPLGAVGEIYVGGVGLSGEYYKRPELTLKAYVENPFGNSPKDKLYKTGDLGRYRSDGTIEFLGRSDQQVKIRGYRIEIDEIERTIQEYNDLKRVVVLVETFGDNDSKRLAGYVTADVNLDVKELKTYLKDRLPDYMVPSLIIQVEEITTLPNGKIDKLGLQKLRIEESVLNSEELILPANDLESKLLDLWKEVLQMDTISTDDNFFDLGGDSILSIQFISKAKKEGMLLSPNQIFDYQTISKLADFLASKKTQDQEWDYLVALRKEGSKNPLFCIHAGGGHIFFYNVLTKHIDANRPIYAIQASGVYAEKGIHESIEQMATDYLRAMRNLQPEGPYNIMVYCFSVAVGHQMAKQLSEQGQVANLIVMDTMADPWNLNTPKRLKMRVKGFLKRSLRNPVKTLVAMVSTRWVHYKSRFSKARATPEEKALLEMNANLGKICKVYDWNPVSGQVAIILTDKEEESINTEIVESWQTLVSGEVKVARTKGAHINLFEEPDVKEVSARIDEFSV